MRSQCHGQRTSLIVQLNSRPVRRIELHTKVCTEALAHISIILALPRIPVLGAAYNEFGNYEHPAITSNSFAVKNTSD